jgi:hypothetical protein
VLAGTFPDSSFVGYDFSEEAIEDAAGPLNGFGIEGAGRFLPLAGPQAAG